MLLRLTSISFSCAVCIVLAGCGSGTNMAEVEGVVKVKGQPVDKIRVEFWPSTDGPRSIAVTGSDGRFIMKAEDGSEDGAVVGTHKVLLSDLELMGGGKIIGRDAAEMDLTKGKKSRIAPDYKNAKSTPLTKEVVAGQKNEFELDVNPPAGK